MEHRSPIGILEFLSDFIYRLSDGDRSTANLDKRLPGRQGPVSCDRRSATAHFSAAGRDRYRYPVGQYQPFAMFVMTPIAKGA
jgi:hypothetical protein